MLTLRDLGVNHDPGTAWHPKPEKFVDGLLPDLDDEQVAEHLTKPEAADQSDAGRSLAAEDSTETPDGEV